jgi:hypothetical protein
MKTIARVLIMPSLLLALAVLQTNLAAQTSNCTNGPNTDGYVQFTCNLYPSTSFYNIPLTPNLTYNDPTTSDNAGLYANELQPGYAVVINGDPIALSDDASGLWNQSLWDAVLEWPGDYNAGYGSVSLNVYYSGFPSVSTVESSDNNMEAYYASQGYVGADAVPDSYFFVQSGNPAVYAAGNNVYNVYPTPEPASALFLAMCLPVLAVGFFVKVKASGSVLHA